MIFLFSALKNVYIVFLNTQLQAHFLALVLTPVLSDIFTSLPKF